MTESKKIYWLLQFTGWIAYTLLIFLSVWTSGQKISVEIITQLVTNVFVCVLISHSMREIIILYDWFNQRLIQIVFYVIVMCIICGFLIQLTHIFINRNVLALHHPILFSKIFINSFAYALVLLCWNGIYFTYLFFKKTKDQEVQTVHLEASKNEMQLKNLRNQLNPHFLFNALNSIRALVDLEPQTAKNAITQLSGLLRKSLLLGDQNTISLAQELEIVQHYLQLEKMRFEERLSYSIQVKNECVLDHSIPPFLIQNLVENGIKHGISKEIDGGNIDISCNLVEGFIVIFISNTGTLMENDGQGIGILNTRKRLQLLYDDSATFSLTQKGDQVVAHIQYLA